MHEPTFYLRSDLFGVLLYFESSKIEMPSLIEQGTDGSPRRMRMWSVTSWTPVLGERLAYVDPTFLHVQLPPSSPKSTLTMH